MIGYTRKTMPIIKLGPHHLKNRISGVELGPKSKGFGLGSIKLTCSFRSQLSDLKLTTDII